MGDGNVNCDTNHTILYIYPNHLAKNWWILLYASISHFKKKKGS